MIYFSKSKYCGLWQCPKIAWLRKYKPEEFAADDALEDKRKKGQEVGELAKSIFGDYVDLTVMNGDDLNIPEMIRRTKTEMEKGSPVICEAAFEWNGLYCAVDILKKEDEGWAIYEVKSSTKDDKAVYFADVAYQNYVLKNCGVNVCGSYLVVLNNEYVFDGELDISELFKITDVTQEAASQEMIIEPNLKKAEKILSSDEEPAIDLSMGCHDPYDCGFWNYCARELPKPSVFDLYRLSFKKKLEHYYRGVVSYEDLIAEQSITNEKHLRQMEYYLFDKGTYVDKDNLREFLDGLTYPLYFLDFETVRYAIPRYIGTRPYQQVAFQYSLHYIEHEGGDLKHKEFLAEPGTDPRRKLAEQLCEDIPMNVCVTAYNKSFECARIKEMAEAFPDLAGHLLNIESNIRDLADPFQSRWYYNKEMGGSFSIKSVLPALFPNDPELDYHALNGVHNGTEAMTIFPKMEGMTPEEQAETRKNLLAYCRLDTLAMVKVWEKLKEAVE